MPTCTWTAYIKNAEGYSPSERSIVLRHLPPEAMDVIEREVKPLIAKQKIQAIKKLREYAGIGLRAAKDLVEDIGKGATLGSCRYNRPSLLDAIEKVEDRLRSAIRAATYDEKAMSALIGIRQQITDLWQELVELPVDPEAR